MIYQSGDFASTLTMPIPSKEKIQKGSERKMLTDERLSDLEEHALAREDISVPDLYELFCTIRELKAEIKSLESQIVKWHSAFGPGPERGSEILLAVRSSSLNIGGVTIGRYSGGSFTHSIGIPFKENFIITHWASLPAGPEEGK